MTMVIVERERAGRVERAAWVWIAGRWEPVGHDVVTL